jgi:Mce-associated membrane protein
VALLTVVAIVVAGLELHRKNHLDAQLRNQRDVATVAAGLGTALLSYDAAHLDVSRHRVLTYSTPEFANTYDRDFTQALAGTVASLNASATARVRDVYVADVTGDAAKAIVVVDLTTRSTAGVRQLIGTNVQMELVRRRGRWLVNTVTVLSAASETQTPSGAPTTTSPAPAH